MSFRNFLYHCLFSFSSFTGSTIFCPECPNDNHENTTSLLRHTMKIINIYYHIFTNQKPLIMAKSQKVEIFGNAKELATTTQCLGYFGNDYIYLRLYQMLKSAYDNYKVRINTCNRAVTRATNIDSRHLEFDQIYNWLWLIAQKTKYFEKELWCWTKLYVDLKKYWK